MRKIFVLLPLILLLAFGSGWAAGQTGVRPSSSDDDEPIINPAPDPGEAPVSARVILTCSRIDYQMLCSLAEVRGPQRYVWDCPRRDGSWKGRPVTIVGVAIGAPYKIMVLEKLFALGARMALVLGWCGSLQSKVKIGHLVLPSAAVSGDGTTPYYAQGCLLPAPASSLQTILRHQLNSSSATWHQGSIMCTDAIYRERKGMVRQYQARGILAVEMEAAALFTVGKFRQVPVATLLVVSDELFTLSWRCGFNSPVFRQARELAAHILLDTAAAWGAP
jgi:purine-nucleoside phosphorylase